jgi:hypothetical protein
VVDHQRERETLAGFSLGLPSFSSMPTKQDKKKWCFEDLLDTREEFSRSLVSSLGRFGKRKRREGDTWQV